MKVPAVEARVEGRSTTICNIVASLESAIETRLIVYRMSKLLRHRATAEIARDAQTTISVSLEVIRCCANRRGIYRRLIPKSAFMHFLAILTFLHILKDKSQGYLKMP